MNNDDITSADYALSSANDAQSSVKALEIRVLALESVIRAAGIEVSDEAVMAAAEEIKSERETAQKAEWERRNDAYRRDLYDKMSRVFTRPSEGRMIWK